MSQAGASWREKKSASPGSFLRGWAEGNWRKPGEAVAASEGGQATCGPVMKPGGLQRCGRVSKELATHGSGWKRESRMLAVFGVSGLG